MKVTVTKSWTTKSEGEVTKCPQCPLHWVEREYGLHQCDLINNVWCNVSTEQIDRNCPLKGFQNPHVYVTDGVVKIVEET